MGSVGVYTAIAAAVDLQEDEVFQVLGCRSTRTGARPAGNGIEFSSLYDTQPRRQKTRVSDSDVLCLVMLDLLDI